MTAELTATQAAALRALCNTYVPSIKVADDPTGFWARSASDMGVPEELARYLFDTVPEPLLGALLGLLDALAAAGLVTAGQGERERILARVARSSPAAAQGLAFYEKRTLLLNYGLPENPPPNQNLVTYGTPGGPSAQNPNWAVMGYPGPVTVPPRKARPMQTLVPAGDQLTLEADVCVVGSGAGGAVIAARMAESGRRVVVLEMGGQYTAADFHQLELWGYSHLWYKGGATPTVDGNVLLLAGGTLGGGTEINWMNCVRTPELVRQDWVRQYGLTGVDSPAFDAYMDTVEARIMASTQTAYYNSQNLRMSEGCKALGYLATQNHVNWDPERFQPLLAGYTGIGDQTGAKQTARRTFLRDAYERGARIMVHCRADTILVEQGRAAGVAATWSDPGGRTAKVTVRAPQVVVACGALESPALLLRSGIGGPAVGQCLHVQPGGAVYGLYDDKQMGWWGSPMTTNCEQFTDTGEGYGFYMEIPAFGPGFVASVIPWTSGRQHKEMMTRVPYISTFIWFLRDRGCGRITIDAAGNSVASYQLSDPIDQQNFRHATAEAIRIHNAAGARQIYVSLAHRQLVWTRGESLERYIANVLRQPLLDGAQPMISAHQLSSCRMGTDPATSVADTDGQLHDVEGVWVGDASACPTALGANPMITIMALAERTADRMLESAWGSRSWSSRQESETLPAMAARMLGEMAGMMTDPVKTLRRMTAFVAEPTSIVALGGRLLSTAAQAIDVGARMLEAPSRPAAAPATPAPMTAANRRQGGPTPFVHIIELTCKPGQARPLARILRDQAIPRVIQPFVGFVDEIVLLSEDDPNHVTAISFWRSKEEADHFDAHGFVQVTALLEDVLAAPPLRRPFDLGASTNPRIQAMNVDLG